MDMRDWNAQCVITRGPDTVSPQRQHQETCSRLRKPLEVKVFEFMVSPDNITLGPSEKSPLLFCNVSVMSGHLCETDFLETTSTILLC